MYQHFKDIKRYNYLLMIYIVLVHYYGWIVESKPRFILEGIANNHFLIIKK